MKLIAIMVVVMIGLTGCGGDDDDVTEAEPTTTTETTAVDLFGTLDLNGDSSLDADEIAESGDDELDSIFTSWDIDRDSELDRDEVAGNAFKLWDADGNGRLTNQEWQAGVENWFPTDYDAVAFGDWDNDGDSELDADEFTESFDVSALGESWVADTVDKEAFKKAYFELYDRDGDDKVSRAEWTRGSQLYGASVE